MRARTSVLLSGFFHRSGANSGGSCPFHQSKKAIHWCRAIRCNSSQCRSRQPLPWVPGLCCALVRGNSFVWNFRTKRVKSRPPGSDHRGFRRDRNQHCPYSLPSFPMRGGHSPTGKPHSSVRIVFPVRFWHGLWYKAAGLPAGRLLTGRVG